MSSKVVLIKFVTPVVLLVVLLFNFVFANSPVTKDSIKTVYGIDILQAQTENELPAVMFQQYSSVKLRPSSEEKLEESLILLPGILDKYPKTVLDETLRRIWFYDDLLVDGVDFAGTYGENEVFISISDLQSIGLTIHHEISTLLLMKYPFDITGWVNSSSEKVPYQLSFESSTKDYSLLGNEELFTEGYLSQYSTKDPENDFNMYAETIFSNPEVMEKLVNTYPKIKERYEHVKKFYLSIDSEFQPVFSKID